MLSQWERAWQIAYVILVTITLSEDHIDRHDLRCFDFHESNIMAIFLCMWLMSVSIMLRVEAMLGGLHFSHMLIYRLDNFSPWLGEVWEVMRTQRRGSWPRLQGQGRLLEGDSIWDVWVWEKTQISVNF